METFIDDYIPEVPDIASYENLDFNFVGYLPLVDITGPFAFYPSHCYPSGVDVESKEKGMNDATKYNSPVIAYVKTGASIE